MGNPLYDRKSIHCSPTARTVKAEPSDFVIVCGEVSVETENQFISEEKEVFRYISCGISCCT